LLLAHRGSFFSTLDSKTLAAPTLRSSRATTTFKFDGLSEVTVWAGRMHILDGAKTRLVVGRRRQNGCTGLDKGSVVRFDVVLSTNGQLLRFHLPAVDRKTGELENLTIRLRFNQLDVVNGTLQADRRAITPEAIEDLINNEGYKLAPAAKYR
jgi:hypothetical protein